MKTIEANSDAVEEFTDYLVSFFGVLKVLPTGEILSNDAEEEPVTITVGDEEKPLSSYRELSRLKKHLMLNVFTDNIINSAPVQWYHRMMSNVVSLTLRDVLVKAIKHKEDIEDEHQYARMELASIFKCNKAVLKDLDKISTEDLLFIHWFKKDKTAQLQTKVFDKEFYDIHGIKSKSINAIQEAFKKIFKVDTEKEFNNTFKFVSSINSVRQCEARLRIYLMTLTRLEKYSLAFGLDMEPMRLDYFEANLPNLVKYYLIACNVTAPAGDVRAELMSQSNAPLPKLVNTPGTPTISLNNPQPELKLAVSETSKAYQTVTGGRIGAPTISVPTPQLQIVQPQSYRLVTTPPVTLLGGSKPAFRSPFS